MPFVCHRSFVSFSFFSRIPSISALDPCHAMPGGFGALGVGQILKWSGNTLQYSLFPVLYFQRPPYKGDFHRNSAHSPTITGESRFGGWDPAEVSSIDVTWPTMPIRDRFTGRLGLWLSVFMKKNHVWSVREAPFNLSPPLCGHCPNSNYTPPPHSNGHPWALFFMRDFTFLPFLPFFLPFFYHFLWISAPNHPGKGLDPPKIK